MRGRETFAEEKFINSLGRSFVDVGLSPTEQTEEETTYSIYKEHKHGSLNPHLFSYVTADRATCSLGETIQDQEIMTRLEGQDDLDASSDDDDSDDDDDDEEEVERVQRESAEPLPVAPGEWQGP